MKHPILTAAMALCAAVAHGAPEAPPTAHDLHAAQCVAALQVHTEGLADQVKSGKEEVRPILLSRLESGAAFVGDTYLHGNVDEAGARALANDALQAQKSLTDAQLAARQTTCAEEGSRLLAASNGLERAVVKRLAKKRMDKLLGS
jgi:hypothetical protein